jgi:hypothetical protein
MSSEVTNTGGAEVTKRKVTIVIEDAEGGFHLSLDVEPPLTEDGSEVRPTPALIAGSVARRAIQELVAQQPPAGGSN